MLTETDPSSWVEPWQMTREEWTHSHEATKPDNLQTDYSRRSKSEAVAKFNEGERLRYGVVKYASERVEAAIRGEIELSREETEVLMDRINTLVSHKDVVEKALSEGKPVPPEVLADYPDLAVMAKGEVTPA